GWSGPGGPGSAACSVVPGGEQRRIRRGSVGPRWAGAATVGVRARAARAVGSGRDRLVIEGPDATITGPGATPGPGCRRRGDPTDEIDQGVEAVGHGGLMVPGGAGGAEEVLGPRGDAPGQDADQVGRALGVEMAHPLGVGPGPHRAGPTRLG